MVYHCVCDDEPDSFIYFNIVYNSDHEDDDTLVKNQTFLFDFQVDYTRIPEPDSDGDEDLENLETRTTRRTHEFDRDWLIGDGDEADIQITVCHILEIIDVPAYRDIIYTLAHKILDLKKPDLPKVEKIIVDLDVIVRTFPDSVSEELEEDEVVEVKLAVAPASEKAVEKYFETVVVESELYCVICMDKIRVGSDIPAGRMPCKHVFHRKCGEEWLRNSGICPLCRTVFPS